jgi:hypothetical protein
MAGSEQAQIDWSLDEDTQRELRRFIEEEPVRFMHSPLLLRMLRESLATSYVPPPDPSRPGERRRFWTEHRVGFVGNGRIQKPDLFLSLDIECPDDIRAQLYKLSVVKPPELFVEIVSHIPRGELDYKLEVYASWGIQYYVVFDWAGWIGEALAIHSFSLENGRYVRLGTPYFPKIGLGVRLWTGSFERNRELTYLRFHDEYGDLLLTSNEKGELKDRRLAERYRAQADFECIRADRERARADAEAEARQKAEAQVRELLQRLADTTRES